MPTFGHCPCNGLGSPSFSLLNRRKQSIFISLRYYMNDLVYNPCMYISQGLGIHRFDMVGSGCCSYHSKINTNFIKQQIIQTFFCFTHFLLLLPFLLEEQQTAKGNQSQNKSKAQRKE